MPKYVIPDDEAVRFCRDQVIEWAKANGLDPNQVDFPIEVDTDSRTITVGLIVRESTHSTGYEDLTVSVPLVTDPPPLGAMTHVVCPHGCIKPT